MLSGNGRHRRPRQAPALFVAAGVTGSAVALPLLGATGAHAADATTWDRVAMCESGGLWSADLGNGLQGGLQFSPETWQRYGGTAYAPSADLASRSQQIAVAEKVLAAEGPSAWPGCADISGLSKQGSGPQGAPDVDPGATVTPEKSAGEAAKADEAGERGKRQAEDRAKRKSADRQQEREPAASTSPEPSASEPSEPARSGSAAARSGTAESPVGAAGKHRGKPAEEASNVPEASESAAVEELAAVGSEAERAGGAHASRARDAVRDKDLAAGAYTVREGDNLWTLADSHEVDGGWAALYEANKESVGNDPDLILPGQSIDFGAKDASGAESAE